MSRSTPKMVLGGLVLLLVVPEPLDAQVWSQTQATPSVEASAVQQPWTGLKLTTTTLTTGKVTTGTEGTGTVTDTGGTGGKVVVTPGGGDIPDIPVCVALPCKKCDSQGNLVPDPSQNGTTCEDGQLCTVGDTCQDGICRSGSQKDCSALGDTCNIGRCDEQSGGCVKQPKADGTTCSDGNACTSGETCNSSGVCGSPTSTVTCNTPPNTQCYLSSGTCSTTDGSCSYSLKPNVPSTGTPTTETCNGIDDDCNGIIDDGVTVVDDGNPCTLDICQGGAPAHPAGNAGASCRASAGTCDVAETCNGTSTTCPGDTVVAAGTTCPTGGADTNPCTDDTCDGTTTNKSCNHPNNTASCAVDAYSCTDDVCSGGACTHPGGTGSSTCCLSDTDCSDGNACNGNETCNTTSHTCVAGIQVTCTPSDTCHTSTCNTATGACAEAVITSMPDVDGDGIKNACDSDNCTSITCTPSDTCHTSTCNTATGACAEAVITSMPDTDNDGTKDACDSDNCTSITCTPSDTCHTAGTCDPTTGQCGTGAAINGCCTTDSQCADTNACNGTETCQNNRCAPGGTPIAVNDGNACTDDSCSDGRAVNTLKAGAECSVGADCNLETCLWNNPICHVTGPGMVAGGQPIEFTVSLSYGGDPSDAAWNCTVSGMDANGNPIPLESSPLTNNRASVESLPEGTTTVTATCTVTVDGKPSEVCSSTTEVGSCGMDCTQPNGTKVVRAGDEAFCVSTAIEGTTCSPPVGSVPVDTSTTGEVTVSATCSIIPPGSPTVTFSCDDIAKVNPECTRLNYRIEGDRLIATFEAKGAVRCQANFNGQTEEVMVDEEGRCPEVSFGTPQQPGSYTLTGSVFGNPGSDPDICDPRDVAGPTCHNAIREGAEECDESLADTPTCINCRTVDCGDGVPQGAEECDDGNRNNEDECTDDCKKPFCSDGILQRAIGEECDDNNTTAGDGCGSTCLTERCGDGIVQIREGCDLGALNGTTGALCAADCTVPPPPCGNGLVDASFGETCEPPNTDTCDAECHTISQTPPSPGQPICGNQQVEEGETCEPPNTPTCNESCHLIPTPRPLTVGYCGDGVIQSPQERCEPPAEGCGHDCQPEEEPVDPCVGAAALTLNCFRPPCLAEKQVTHLNICTDSSLSLDRPNRRVYLVRNQETLASRTAPTPQEYTPGRPTTQTTPVAETTLCECAAPQETNVEGGTCTNNLYSLPCIHPDQMTLEKVSELRARGITVDTVTLPGDHVGYQFEALLTSRECNRIPGSEMDVTPLEEGTEEPRVHCRFTRPACLCEETPAPQPEPEPEVTEGEPPTTLEAPPTPPPPAPPPEPTAPQVLGPAQPTPTARTYEVFVCRSGTSVAYGTISGEEISITPCPQLPVEEALAAPQVEMARNLSRFLKDRQSGQLDKVRQLAETTLMNWKQGGLPDYPVRAIRVPTEGAETTAGEPEPASVITITPNNLEIEVPTDQGQGPIFHVVNAPAPSPAPTTGGPPPQAQGQGPQGGPQAAAMTLSTSDNFYESLAEATNVATTRAVPVVPVEFLQVQGGACSLIKENNPSKPGSLRWTLLLPLLMMGAWRFRPQRPKASISSSINTPKRGFSTKN